jgi:hypothetical protein
MVIRLLWLAMVRIGGYCLLVDAPSCVTTFITDSWMGRISGSDSTLGERGPSEVRTNWASLLVFVSDASRAAFAALFLVRFCAFLARSPLPRLERLFPRFFSATG